MDRPGYVRCENCVHWDPEPDDPTVGACDGLPLHITQESPQTCAGDYCALWSDAWPRGSMRTESEEE